MIEIFSPNFEERKLPIDMIVLHYTGMQSTKNALERLCNAETKVSSHYLVDENGKVFHLVDEKKRAYHAGVSFWKGRRDINSCSIGIEISNPGHEFGYIPFPKKQVASVINLCQDIQARNTIKYVLGHSDVAPTRKQDPGELFPWELLAENNIGFWTNDFLDNEYTEQELLEKIGYDISNFEMAKIAFCRHFYPRGLEDLSNQKIIQRMQAVFENVTF